MLKLNCGFSRKVGEANYGSRGASVNLELEIATEAAQNPESLNDKIRRLFALAKKAVDDELNGQPTGNRTDSPEFPSEPEGNGNGDASRGGNGSAARPGGNGDAATNKQTKLILDLGRARKMSMSVIERLCQETTGVSDVYGLSKKQASAIIDRLKQHVAPRLRGT